MADFKPRTKILYHGRLGNGPDAANRNFEWKAVPMIRARLSPSDRMHHYSWSHVRLHRSHGVAQEVNRRRMSGQKQGLLFLPYCPSLNQTDAPDASFQP